MWEENMLSRASEETTTSCSSQVVSQGVTSFTLCALGIDRFHAATSSSQPKARQVERCRSVLLKLLLVWLSALLLSSPEIFLWQLSQAVSPSTGRLVDSCTITPASPLSLYLPDSLHSLLLRYHQVSRPSGDLRCLTWVLQRALCVSGSDVVVFRLLLLSPRSLYRPLPNGYP